MEIFKRLWNKIKLIPLTIREKSLLKHKKFIIISNNCWGYSLYNTLDRTYNTPFVGLFVPPTSYINLLKNFPDILKSELHFIEHDAAYPIAYLGDKKIEIHFLHYESNVEADEKWRRRTKRFFDDMNQGTELFFKFCDSEGCTAEQVKQFHSLAFKNKISFTVNNYQYKENLYVPFLKDEKTASIVNGLQLYKNRYSCFDFAYWILNGTIKRYRSID